MDTQIPDTCCCSLAASMVGDLEKTEDARVHDVDQKEEELLLNEQLSFQ